ncbi:hypothetical protein SPHV1_2170048 [Novosphingobium sp. KN65.2]|nr:hypothetical protein SPHV1_2170048 [Novosphingobium sp. KN65.2]
MVPGQQPPAAVVSVHARDRLHDGAIFRAFGVEYVAGYDNVLSAMFGGGSPKRVDGFEAGFRQRPADVGIEAAERFAELPISGVDKLHLVLIASPAADRHPICFNQAQFFRNLREHYNPTAGNS